MEYPWAICHDGGISDRHRTREEAETELPKCLPGGTVEYVGEDW